MKSGACTGEALVEIHFVSALEQSQNCGGVFHCANYTVRRRDGLLDRGSTGEGDRMGQL